LPARTLRSLQMALMSPQRWGGISDSVDAQ